MPPHTSSRFASLETWQEGFQSASADLRHRQSARALTPELARAVLQVAHLRREPPLAEIWKASIAERWPLALAAARHLADTDRAVWLALLAARFAESENESGMKEALGALRECRAKLGETAEFAISALAQCLDRHPGLIGELMACRAVSIGALWKNYAQTRSTAQVAEVFRQGEESGLGHLLEEHVADAAGRQKRSDLALACLPLIHRDTTPPPEWAHRPKRYAVEGRRDRLRQYAAGLLGAEGKTEESIAMYRQMHDWREGLCGIVRMLTSGAQPDAALKVMRELDPSYRGPGANWLVSNLAIAFARQGRMRDALDCYNEFSQQLDDTHRLEEVFAAGLRAGAAEEALAALELVASRGERAKIEKLLARKTQRVPPKSRVAKAEALASEARTPALAQEKAREISTYLADSRPAERPVIRAALVRALVAAGQHEEALSDLQTAKAETMKLKSAPSRRQACAESAPGLRRGVRRGHRDQPRRYVHRRDRLPRRVLPRRRRFSGLSL